MSSPAPTIEYEDTPGHRAMVGALLGRRPELAEHAILRAGVVARDLAAELGIRVSITLWPDPLPPLNVAVVVPT